MSSMFPNTYYKYVMKYLKFEVALCFVEQMCKFFAFW